MATNGILSGTPSTTASTYYFDVIVTDAASNTQELDALPLTIVNPPALPLAITNISLPNGNVGAAYSAQLGATGGQSPYNWSLALGSLPSRRRDCLYFQRPDFGHADDEWIV